MEFGKGEIISVIAALCAAIVALWAIIRARNTQDKKDLDACNKFRDEANEKILELTKKYSYLEGRIDAVESLSSNVLEKIQERRKYDEPTVDRNTLHQ
jgi:hypothetical protein